MSKKTRKRWQRRLIKLLVFVIILALLAGGFFLFVMPGLAAEATSVYDSYAAATGSISNSMTFDGNISVKNDETFSTTSSATVRQIYVSEEQAVSANDKLMRLSNGETVKANFDGKVNQIYVEQGDEVSANENLIQIADFDNMKVTVRVDEYDISSVVVGQACTVNVTALDLTLDSVITHINRIATSSGTVAYYTVTAELAVAESVLPGMQVTLTITQEEALNAVILNRNALSFDRSNSAYVLMYNDANELEQVPVEIGVDNDNYVEIVSGLSEGDTVYALNVEDTNTSALGMFGMMGGGGMQMRGGNRESTQQRGGQEGNFPGGSGGGMPGGGTTGR